MSTHNDRRQRVEDACAALLAAGQPVAFDEVATRAGIGRATLYRNPDLRALVEEHRARGREAHTLTGLTNEITHLRIALDTLATKVRRHEEQLRRLRHHDERTGS
jgi:AcrR family transcriptional regulator